MSGGRVDIIMQMAETRIWIGKTEYGLEKLKTDALKILKSGLEKLDSSLKEV